LARWTNEDLLGPAEAALVGRVELSVRTAVALNPDPLPGSP
jgi:hypothetical protein